MIRKITLFLMLFFPIVAGAFTIGDLSYTVTNNSKLTVSVGSATTSISGDVVIPATVKYDSLEYIVTSIASGGFRYCDSLTSIEIPNSVTKIENSAFYACSILTSIDIPNSVTSIGERAFYNCKGLNLMDVPDSVATIGKNAFYGIDTIFYAGNATGAPWGVFYKVIRGTVKDGDFVYADSTKSCIVGYLGSDSVIVIPNTVTAIGANAFHSYTKLTSIVIPNSVTSIGKSAFYGCKGLNPPDVPESVDIIEQYAFYGIDTIFYAGKATGEPWGAKRVIRGIVRDSDFVYADSTKSCIVGYLGADSVVVIPNAVTVIGDNAFKGYANLTSIEIPNSVTAIGSSAFYGCSSLTVVEIPDSVTSIGASAFYDCNGLNQLIVPESVDTIGENAFYGIEKVFYNGKASGNPWSAYNVVCEYFIEDDFAYSDSTKSCIVGYFGADSVVVIPNAVTVIGDNAFKGYANLTSIEIPNSVTAVGSSAFYGCSSLTSIDIPNSVTGIGEQAFNNCKGLKFLSIPDSVSFIGENAFLGVDTISYFGDAEGLPWGAKIIIHDHVYDYCYCGICGQRDSVSHCIFDIYTADDLFEFARLVNEGNQWLDARLMNDIVVNDNIDCTVDPFMYECSEPIFDSVRSWIPIGVYSGVFDGQNHVIKGLYGIYSDHIRSGFISVLDKGEIKNVGFEDLYLFACWECSISLILESYYSKFKNCYITGVVASRYGGAAGLVESSYSTSFEGCYNAAAIRAQGNVAGLTHYKGGELTMENCWNLGSCSSSYDKAAGLLSIGARPYICIGNYYTDLDLFSDSLQLISNCYNIGTISAKRKGAGLVFDSSHENTFIFENCYNMGSVNSGQSHPLYDQEYYSTHELKNLYYLEGCVEDSTFKAERDSLWDIHSMTSEQFANGEVCYRLNKGVTDGTQPFYQNLADIRPASSDMQSITIDPYPVLDKSHRTVYTDSVSYFNRLETTSEKVVSTTIVEPKIYSDGNTLYVKNATGRVVLYEVNGRVVYSKKAEENAVIEISNLKAGVYLLVVDGSPYKVVVR